MHETILVNPTRMGLSSLEAAEKLKQFGVNRLPEKAGTKLNINFSVAIQESAHLYNFDRGNHLSPARRIQRCDHHWSCYRLG